MSCNPALRLGFSFCQSGSSCSGLLVSWHPGQISDSPSTAPWRCMDHIYIRAHIYIYLYHDNTRLSLPEVGHDCERLSLEARMIWEGKVSDPNAGI